MATHNPALLIAAAIAGLSFASEGCRRSDTLTVERVATLIGKPLEVGAIEAVVGPGATELPADHDPGHPEDERHYFVVPHLGLQILAGADRSIKTLFFMLDGDAGVSGHPWSLHGRLTRGSRRTDVRAHLGAPEKSGGPSTIRGLPPTGGWDRFKYPPFGYLHVQYAAGDGHISMFTVMTEAP
jgi:hypothetical protein